MSPLSAAMIEYCCGGTAPAPPLPGTAPAPPPSGTAPALPPPGTAPVPGQGRRAPAGPPPARSKLGRKTAERPYAIETLREGALRILRAEHAGTKPPSARVVSREAGYPSMQSTLGRLVALARKQGQPDVQDAFVAAFNFPGCSRDDFSLRKIFSEDEPDGFAEVIKYATRSGFGYDVEGTRELMRHTVEATERCPLTGELFAVSRAYVSRWLASRKDISKPDRS